MVLSARAAAEVASIAAVARPRGEQPYQLVVATMEATVLIVPTNRVFKLTTLRFQRLRVSGWSTKNAVPFGTAFLKIG